MVDWGQRRFGDDIGGRAEAIDDDINVGGRATAGGGGWRVAVDEFDFLGFVEEFVLFEAFEDAGLVGHLGGGDFTPVGDLRKACRSASPLPSPRRHRSRNT